MTSLNKSIRVSLISGGGFLKSAFPTVLLHLEASTFKQATSDERMLPPTTIRECAESEDVAVNTWLSGYSFASYMLAPRQLS